MSSTPPPSGAPPNVPDHDALPPGTRFGELEIVSVLGVGGFGIVYLARDHSLERDIALKEYMPASLAARGVGPQITVRSGSFAETYAIGLRSFINEARLLARFDHPALVKVYRFWEANATAYMVMPYLQGRTLRDVRRAMSQPPSEAFIRKLLDALLSALAQLHGEEVYHRDIAPDNILLSPDGAPILLDFGAARRVITDRTQSLTAILKPNYAPIEQYAEMTQMRQGPWTDIYALGAVAHFLIFGKPPSPATARAVQDDLGSLPQRLVPGISPRLLSIVAWMLAVRPQQRPQNVAELRAALEGRSPVPDVGGGPAVVRTEPVAPATGQTQFPPTMKVDARPGPSRHDTAAPPVAATRPPDPDDDQATVIRPASARAAVAAATVARQPMPQVKAPPVAAPPVEAPPVPPSRRAAGAVTAALVLAGAAFAYWHFSAPRTAADPASGAASAPASIATPAAEPASSAAAVVEAPAAAPAVPAVASQIAALATEPPAASAPRPAAANRAAAAAATAALARAATQTRPMPKPAARTSAAEQPLVIEGPSTRNAEPVVVPDPAPRPSAPVAAAEPDVPATAREACGKRVFLALWTCMDRECERPRYRDHPDCQKVLDVKRRRGQQ